MRHEVSNDVIVELPRAEPDRSPPASAVMTASAAQEGVGRKDRGGTRSADPHAARLTPGWRSIAILAALAALGQFASNVYTPSLPAVAAAFAIGQGAAQATLAVFLAAFAVAQLVYGPVSDRFGRRPVLVAGLALFLAGTLACIAAPSFAVLLAGRMVQAIGAAAAIVMSRAMTRDSFDGPELTRVLATVTIAFALVPGLTPLLGGVLEATGGWRAAFAAMSAAGLACLVMALRTPETSRRRTNRLSFGDSGLAYAATLADPTFRTYSLAAGCVLGSMSAFFAGSPALFIERLGVSPVEYGLYPPLSVTGFVIGGLITRRLASQVPPRRIAGLGLLLLAVGAAMMVALPLLGLLHAAGFAVAMVVHVTGLGLLLPTAVGQALSRFPDRAGAAAAMNGFLQMGGGALGATASSLVHPLAPVLGFPLVMLSAVALALAVFTLGGTQEAADGVR